MLRIFALALICHLAKGDHHLCGQLDCQFHLKDGHFKRQCSTASPLCHHTSNQSLSPDHIERLAIIRAETEKASRSFADNELREFVVILEEGRRRRLAHGSYRGTSSSSAIIVAMIAVIFIVAGGIASCVLHRKDHRFKYVAAPCGCCIGSLSFVVYSLVVIFSVLGSQPTVEPSSASEEGAVASTCSAAQKTAARLTCALPPNPPCGNQPWCAGASTTHITDMGTPNERYHFPLRNDDCNGGCCTPQAAPQHFPSSYMPLSPKEQCKADNHITRTTCTIDATACSSFSDGAALDASALFNMASFVKKMLASVLNKLWPTGPTGMIYSLAQEDVWKKITLPPKDLGGGVRLDKFDMNIILPQAYQCVKQPSSDFAFSPFSSSQAALFEL